MSNKYWNDVDQENIDMANLILEDSVNINTDGVYQDGLLRNTQNSKTKTYRSKKQKIYSAI